jgi:hypothetical protein
VLNRHTILVRVLFFKILKIHVDCSMSVFLASANNWVDKIVCSYFELVS